MNEERIEGIITGRSAEPEVLESQTIMSVSLWILLADDTEIVPPKEKRAPFRERGLCGFVDSTKLSLRNWNRR